MSAIIIGTNTALVDNPELTTRLYPGNSPIRVIIDKKGKIQQNANVKNNKSTSWIYTHVKDHKHTDTIRYCPIKSDNEILSQICTDLYENNCNTLLVEGGAKLLNSFIDAGLWDEARIITSSFELQNGIQAPTIKGISISKFEMYTDEIELILNPNNVIYS